MKWNVYDIPLQYIPKKLNIILKVIFVLGLNPVKVVLFKISLYFKGSNNKGNMISFLTLKHEIFITETNWRILHEKVYNTLKNSFLFFFFEINGFLCLFFRKKINGFLFFNQRNWKWHLAGNFSHRIRKTLKERSCYLMPITSLFYRYI